ncbi:hypothetical protein Trydic_g16527 [Trypoxylus dichotomus]
MEGVMIGSPLRPMVANFFMKGMSHSREPSRRNSGGQAYGLVEMELDYLRRALRYNGCPENIINGASTSKPPPKDRNGREPQTLGTAYLPYINRTTDRIGRVLERFYSNTTSDQLTTTSQGTKGPIVNTLAIQHTVFMQQSEHRHNRTFDYQ